MTLAVDMQKYSKRDLTFQVDMNAQNLNNNNNSVALVRERTIRTESEQTAIKWLLL
jgi:hypothetical protein